MENFKNFESWRKKQHLREVLLGYYFSKKTPAESHRLLLEVYGDDALSESRCWTWFQRFKNGDFDIKDKERPGQTKKFDDADLMALLDEDPCQTQEELAKTLGVAHATISRRLKAMRMIQKQGSWTHVHITTKDATK